VVGASGLPAVDGSLLTGIVSYTKSASDPTLSTNPATGVGTEWVNHTTGKQFICTDATAGANVWKVSGGGSGDVVPWAFGGTTYGFAVAGYLPSNYPGNNSISKFSFTTDGDATDWNDLAGTGQYLKSGHSDKDNGYGYHAGGTGSAAMNEIARFSFTSSGGSTDVGDLSMNHDSSCSVSTQSYGFCVGGTGNPRIDRIAFASSSNGTDWADLSYTPNAGAGATNEAGTYGYKMGGSPPTTNIIQKFPTASQSDSTDVADTTVARHSPAGNSSSTHGYCAGGYTAGAPTYNIIDKFAFATDANSTDVGDLTIAGHQVGGSSSLTYGYSLGGSGAGNRMDKFSFSTDGNATDIGNLIMGQIGPSGSQV
jgi:hypothetical protein